MVKKTAPIFNDTYDDDSIELEPLIIKNETDIIYHYNDALTVDEMDLVHMAVINFEVDDKISEYNAELYDLYKSVVEEFVQIECPTHIFDTGLHNSLMTNFIDYAYYNSDKGQELEFIKKIEDDFLEKEYIEDQNLLKFRGEAI